MKNPLSLSLSLSLSRILSLFVLLKAKFLQWDREKLRPFLKTTKGKYVSALICIGVVFLLSIAINIPSNKEKPSLASLQNASKQDIGDEPVILSASALPQKVKIGDTLTITAEIQDKNGIEKVSAIMPYENNRADEIQLSLIEGDNKNGKWQGQWKCHDTINKEYITTITAVNILGKSSQKQVSWWDDTETVWYSQNWPLRKKISLSSATPAAYYQVKVTLTTAIMGNPYANVKANGDDIRFVQANGTLLDYWIETWAASGDSTLWVEVATSGTSTIYIYYGNPSAASASNGTNTFVFFDDFNDNTITGWTVRASYGTFTEQNNRMEWLTTSGLNVGAITLSNSISGSTITEFTQKWLTGTDTNYRQLAIAYWTSSSYMYLTGDYTNGFINSVVGYSPTEVLNNPYGSTVLFKVKNVYDGTKFLVYNNDVLKRNITIVLQSPYYIGVSGINGANESQLAYIDNFHVRKYAATEPTATVSAVEEHRPRTPGASPSGGGVMMF